ncbi:MAG TPA: methyltransferase domain-containing protein [Sphingomicrobium sp.]|jgi:ubiquinone/menaquinone biosynthesis C-methylase UbiE|nr:methyltransferase domain-containing protein [Sphingomicrobium sp.]
MKDQELRFSGSVPAKYDLLMVPLIFRPYAEELARRAAALKPKRILETAAGTGAVTQALNQAMPDVKIVATDLNQPMLDMAAERLKSDQVTFTQADAQDLPFDDGAFDLVVCQFGSMFFPDKVRGHAEARRVLCDGGHYLLAIWDRIDRNDLTNAAQKVLIDSFPDDPPMFMTEGPFGYSDTHRIEQDLHEAGFDTVDIETVELKSRSPSARDAATALCYGTPMGTELEDREPGSLERVFERVEEALRRFEGPEGIDAPMAAHIVLAAK